jgi:hypothetical protein
MTVDARAGAGLADVAMHDFGARHRQAFELE